MTCIGWPVAFEQRDVARLGAARRQVEQCPLVRARIVFGDLVGAPQIGPDVVASVDRDLIGLVALRDLGSGISVVSLVWILILASVPPNELPTQT